MSEPKYYSQQEVMDYFRVTRWAIRRAIESGKLRVAKKEKGRNYFSEEDIQNFIENSRD